MRMSVLAVNARKASLRSNLHTCFFFFTIYYDHFYLFMSSGEKNKAELLLRARRFEAAMRRSFLYVVNAKSCYVTLWEHPCFPLLFWIQTWHFLSSMLSSCDGI